MLEPSDHVFYWDSGTLHEGVVVKKRIDKYNQTKYLIERKDEERTWIQFPIAASDTERVKEAQDAERDPYYIQSVM